MQLTRLVPALLVSLMLGFLACVAGCGSATQQGALADQVGAAMEKQNKGVRELQKQVRESAKAKAAERRSGGTRAKRGS